MSLDTSKPRNYQPKDGKREKKSESTSKYTRKKNFHQSRQLKLLRLQLEKQNEK
jgi:hypothetical protein